MKNPAPTAIAGALALALVACGEPAQAPEPKAPGSQPSSAAPPNAVAVVEPDEKPDANPAGSVSADYALTSRVKKALPSTAGGGHIEVVATGGVVTLYGTVDAPAEKERVALAAMNVEGVRSVVNNLVVVRGS